MQYKIFKTVLVTMITTSYGPGGGGGGGGGWTGLDTMTKNY